MSDVKRSVSVTNQLVTFTDGGGFDKIVHTSAIVDTLKTLNRFFDTQLIDPGLKYLSCDYHVDNKIRCDVMVEVPPHRRKLAKDLPEIFMPWVSITFTLEAPVTNVSFITVAPDSVAIYISPTQIFNVLSSVYVPSFLNDVNDKGIIVSESFYETVNDQRVPYPARLTSCLGKIFAGVFTSLTYDPKHPDFVKMCEVQLTNGYDLDFTPKQAAEKKFLFDFSFLPSFEVYDLIADLGFNHHKSQPAPSLYDFLLSKTKD